MPRHVAAEVRVISVVRSISAVEGLLCQLDFEMISLAQEAGLE